MFHQCAFISGELLWIWNCSDCTDVSVGFIFMRESLVFICEGLIPSPDPHTAPPPLPAVSAWFSPDWNTWPVWPPPPPRPPADEPTASSCNGHSLRTCWWTYHLQKNSLAPDVQKKFDWISATGLDQILKMCSSKRKWRFGFDLEKTFSMCCSKHFRLGSIWFSKSQQKSRFRVDFM